MGRYDGLSGPVIIVNADGKIAGWCDGLLKGDADVIKAAKDASIASVPLELYRGGPEAVAQIDDPQNPVGAFAALYAYAGDRTTIIKAPDVIWQALNPEGDAEYTEDDEILEDTEYPLYQVAGLFILDDSYDQLGAGDDEKENVNV